MCQCINESLSPSAMQSERIFCFRDKENRLKVVIESCRHCTVCDQRVILVKSVFWGFREWFFISSW